MYSMSEESIGIIFKTFDECLIFGADEAICIRSV